MIYLASVYSLNADADLMQKRFEFVRDFVAANIHDEPLFSPILYTHDLAKIHRLPKKYDFWQARDRHFIECCSEVWVLTMPGWKDSIGVTDEINYALEIGKQVKLIPVSEIYSE